MHDDGVELALWGWQRQGEFMGWRTGLRGQDMAGIVIHAEIILRRTQIRKPAMAAADFEQPSVDIGFNKAPSAGFSPVTGGIGLIRTTAEKPFGR